MGFSRQLFWLDVGGHQRSRLATVDLFSLWEAISIVSQINVRPTLLHLDLANIESANTSISNTPENICAISEGVEKRLERRTLSIGTNDPNIQRQPSASCTGVISAQVHSADMTTWSGISEIVRLAACMARGETPRSSVTAEASSSGRQVMHQTPVATWSGSGTREANNAKDPQTISLLTMGKARAGFAVDGRITDI